MSENGTEMITPAPELFKDDPQKEYKTEPASDPEKRLVGNFLEHYIRLPLEERPDYDLHSELAIAGGDNAVWLKLQAGKQVDFAEVVRTEGGKVESIHLKVNESSDDVYISGKALEDLRNFNKDE